MLSLQANNGSYLASASAMNDEKKPLTRRTSGSEVDAFLKKLAAAPARADAARGRLLFGLDATASRQPTWDRAARIQSEMFTAAATVGGLKIQLCFYRGFGEFKVTPWTSQASDLVRMMTSVSCRAGETQIRKVLQHAVNEAQKERVGALVFVGDCIEENIDLLARIAGQLGTLGVPAFMFHEGNDARAAYAFKEIARLSNGAYCQFDAGSADALRDLLCAVAVYAAGGQAALDRLAVSGGHAVKRIAHQMQSR
jgi:hypothetical protein